MGWWSRYKEKRKIRAIPEIFRWVHEKQDERLLLLIKHNANINTLRKEYLEARIQSELGNGWFIRSFDFEKLWKPTSLKGLRLLDSLDQNLSVVVDNNWSGYLYLATYWCGYRAYKHIDRP